jgi:chromosome segregation ATPase
LKQARSLDRLIAEKADGCFIENRYKDKEEEYDKLQEKIECLSKEKERLLQEAQESEMCLQFEFNVKEAEMLRVAEELRNCWLKEKREADEREQAIITKANHRVEEMRGESERMRTELKQLSEQAQTTTEEFEERVRTLKKDFNERAMRLLQSSKEREDQLKSKLAKEIALKKEAEENYQKVVHEKYSLAERLKEARDTKDKDRAIALREKLDLEELIECQKTDFQHYQNTIDAELNGLTKKATSPRRMRELSWIWLPC